MTQEKNAQDQIEQEALVAEWLKATPGFFERHANLLAEIQLKNPHGDRAISLQERQMEIVREKLKVMELRLSDLQFLSVLDSLKLELALGSLDLLTINKLQTMLSMQCTKVNKSCLVENTRLAELAQNFSRMLHRTGEENVGAKSLSEAL